MALLLVIRWAAGTESEKRTLGGLDGSAEHLFNWHPVLMVFGFTVCMGEGVQAFRTLRLGKAQNKRLHAALHGSALVSVIIALRVVFASHNRANQPNLYTAHGIVGLAVCILFFAQYIIGAMAFLSHAFFSDSEKATLLRPHVLVGICVYFLSVVAIASGVAEKAAWMGCSYYVKADYSLGKVALDSPDINPAVHYHLLPLGCKLGIGVVVSAFLSAFFVAIGVVSLRVGKETDHTTCAYQPLPFGAPSGVAV